MKLLKEPLLHFLALGALLFGVHAWREARRLPEGNDSGIAVTAAVIERLRAGYERQFGQAPDAEALRGLVEAHIREEVLCREALALGLDREDTIIRRRLAQKMEFLTEDLGVSTDPDEKELQAYFTEHASRYARPGRLSFRHVYFSRERRGEGVATAAAAGRTALGRGASDEALGDPFLHGFEFDGREAAEIATLFGPEFARQIGVLRPGVWSDPVASSYGLHLVRVEGRSETRPVTLQEVRPTLVRDFQEDRRQAANRELWERYRRRYAITVDEAALAQAAKPTPPATQASR